MGGRFEEIFHLIRVLLQIEEPRLAAGGINQFIAVGHRAEPAFGNFGRAQDRNVLPFVTLHLSEKAIGISAIHLEAMWHPHETGHSRQEINATQRLLHHRTRRHFAGAIQQKRNTRRTLKGNALVQATVFAAKISMIAGEDNQGPLQLPITT